MLVTGPPARLAACLPTCPPVILAWMNIKAVVHKAEEGGYWAEVPALPGCVTQAESMEELRRNLREAIEGWLEAGTPESAANQGDEILELAV